MFVVLSDIRCFAFESDNVPKIAGQNQNYSDTETNKLYTVFMFNNGSVLNISISSLFNIIDKSAMLTSENDASLMEKKLNYWTKLRWHAWIVNTLDKSNNRKLGTKYIHVQCMRS